MVRLRRTWRTERHAYVESVRRDGTRIGPAVPAATLVLLAVAVIVLTAQIVSRVG
jgi:hypothetical protein